MVLEHQEAPMHIFLNEELVEKARVVARAMIESGHDFEEVMGTETDREPARFRLQRTSSGLIVLGQFDEQGQTFFFGTPSS